MVDSRLSLPPPVVQDLSQPNLTVSSEAASKSASEDPFQDPGNVLADSSHVSRQTSINQVSRQTSMSQVSRTTSVSMAREQSTESGRIPQVAVGIQRATSDVSAVSEEVPVPPTAETQVSNASNPRYMPFVSPIHTVSSAEATGVKAADEPRRISISPLPSPVAPRDESGAKVEPRQPVSVSQPEPSQEEQVQPPPIAAQVVPPISLQETAPAVPAQMEIPESDQPTGPTLPTEEQLRAVREFLKPEDLERLTRGPQFVNNIPQYDDPRRRTAQPRPFSFASQGNEEVLQTRSQGPPIPQDTIPSTGDDDLKGLEDELSRSFSRPFQDPNIQDHPAFRQEPSPRILPAPQPSYPPKPIDPRMDQDRMQYYVHRESFPRQGTMTEYQLPGVGPPSLPVVQPQRKLSKSRSRSRSRSGIFRSKSKSRDEESAPPSRDAPLSSRDAPLSRDSDVSGPPEQKKKRLSIFRTLSRAESDSDAASTRVNASGSRTDLMSQPYNQIQPNNYAAGKNEPKEKDAKKIKKLQRSSTSNVAQESKKKKKMFSGIGVSFISTSKFRHANVFAEPVQSFWNYRSLGQAFSTQSTSPAG
jgi:hypothetical protein